MSSARQTARGVIWNWIALGFGFGVTFFMTPFIVHRLGSVSYGVWTLVLSTTSYMGLLDLGLRGAVIRFVSRNHTVGRHVESSRAVSGALWLRQWISLTVILLSVALAFFANRLFAVPGESQHAAQWAIVLSGVGVGLTLYFGVFSGVLAALHRFDLLSGMSVAQTVVRTAAVVWVLKNGYGILGLGILELTLAVVMGLAQTYLCFANYPELRISLKFPGKEVLKTFAAYSVWVFLIHIFGQVIYYTDNIVVGAFVSLASVAFYSIGGSLIEYLRSIVSSLTATFMPLTSKYEAGGETENLRSLLINGTRLALIVALPVQLVLFFRGETFINLWIGPEFGPISGHVLRILLVGQVFTLANATSMNISFGLAKHKAFAIWMSGEALANIALSIFLARRIGIYGVAIGTVIPTLITHMFLWPRYISKIVGVPLGRYLFQAWMKPALAAVPFGLACYFADRYWPAARLIGFFSQVAATLPLYLLLVALSFSDEIVRLWRMRSKEVTAPDDLPGASRSDARHVPLVSIGVPVYNGEQFIAQALDSLLSQTFKDFEIIICDNDSQDRTQEICSEYARRDPRIRYYRNATNVGLAGNCQRTLDLATGKYFKYSAHDDLCAPELLERCVDVLDRHPDVILAYPKTLLLDETSGQLTEYEDGQNLQSPRASERFAQLLFRMRLCNTIFGLTRTSELRKTGGLPRYLSADVILMAELSLRGKFHEIPEYLFRRRLHPSASSSMKGKEQLEEYLEPAVAIENRADLFEWHHLFGHLGSIFRTPLQLRERARLIIILLRMAVWKRNKLFREIWRVLDHGRARLSYRWQKAASGRHSRP